MHGFVGEILYSDNEMIGKNLGCLLCPLTVVIRIRLLALPLLSFYRANLFTDFRASYPLVARCPENRSPDSAE